MKVTETYVRRLMISEVVGLDPIRVLLEDIGPGQGRINIECYGEAWANYWGGMGKDTIAEFIIGCDVHYIAGKLSSIQASIFDPERLIESLMKSVISDRRRGLISHREARSAYDRIVDLDPLPDTIEGLWYMAATMQDLLGDEWWNSLPNKANPDYVYLTRIVMAVQQALAAATPPAA